VSVPLAPDAKRHLGGGVYSGFRDDQFGTLIGLPDFGGEINEPVGTTTCFGFLGFLASLLLRN
jgi:hypothetical protein